MVRSITTNLRNLMRNTTMPTRMETRNNHVSSDGDDDDDGNVYVHAVYKTLVSTVFVLSV